MDGPQSQSGCRDKEISTLGIESQSCSPLACKLQETQFYFMHQIKYCILIVFV